MTTENHRPVPGRVPVARSGGIGRPVRRPVRPEPSWGRVLLTTVELWASRRLRHPAFLRRLVLAVVAVAVVAVVSLQFAGVFSASASAPRVVRPSAAERPAAPRIVPPGPAALAQSAAAAWITSQVSGTAVIGCYPAMCASLEARGVSAGRLVPLGSGMAGVLRTDVVAILPSAGNAGSTLVGQYAPALIASFGSGGSRVEVRAVARNGAASYQSALRADLAARKSAAAQLLKNSHLKFTAADGAQLRSGVVDSRLLATLAALSTQFTLRVTAFGDSAPGGPRLFRSVTVASAGGRNGAARLAAALAMVNAQQSPYQPARAAIVNPGTGQAALTIEFASPSPLGLLSMVLTADVHPDERSLA